MLIENGVKTPVLLSKIKEGIVLPVLGTAGDYFVVTNPLETYKWNTLTSTWDIVKIVKLCEFVILLGVLQTGVINYAFNRKYESDIFTITSGLNTYDRNVNIGTSNVKFQASVKQAGQNTSWVDLDFRQNSSSGTYVFGGTIGISFDGNVAGIKTASTGVIESSWYGTPTTSTTADCRFIVEANY